MDGSVVIDASREAIQVALWLGGPLLLVALVAGLLVGVGQTLTQMHEPVVGQVARLVAVLTVVVFALPWLVGRWVAYAVRADRLDPRPVLIRSGVAFPRSP